jgi:large subunit ribosomal protein L29
MKTKELREMTVEELATRTRELRKEALNLRIQQASGQLENPSRLKDLGREVARIETIISERRLGLTGRRKQGNVGAKAPKTPTAKAAAEVKKPAAKKAPAKKAAAKKAAKAATE